MHNVPDYAPLCAAPDRRTRPPRLPFPARACDCHAHIFGPAAQFPYVAERIYTPPDSTWTDYLALLDVLGVERAVLVQPSVYGTDNSAMLAALAAAGSGVRAVAVADPDISARELEEWHRAGVRGLRFNVVDRRDDRNVIPADMLRAVAARIAPFGWHLELLVNLDEAAISLAFSRRYRFRSCSATWAIRAPARAPGRRRRPSPTCCASSPPASAGSS